MKVCLINDIVALRASSPWAVVISCGFWFVFSGKLFTLLQKNKNTFRMDDFLIETINSLSDCVNHYLDTVNMELDVSFENGMPPVISRRGWPLPRKLFNENYQVSFSLVPPTIK